MVLSATISLYAVEADFTYQGVNYTVLDEDAKTCKTAKITETTHYSGALVIPETVYNGNDAYTVVEIEAYSFFGQGELTTVSIPNTVSIIGDGAFERSGLTTVTIPNSVTTIGRNTFCNCHNLTSITISNSLASVGSQVFFGCENLTSAIFADGTTHIAEGVLHRCSSLTSVSIPNSVISIGESAFAYCSGLKSISIPNSVRKIGSKAFIGCSGLTSFIFPNYLTAIEDATFYDCNGLVSITIPNSVISIGEGAFGSCDGLTSMVIADSVTSIGEGALSNCSNLTSVVISNSIMSIQKSVFKGCIHLSSLTIPNSVISIGESAFYDCSDLTSLVIPNSVKTIESLAFSGCRGLTSVTIPSSVTLLEGGVFSRCTNLNEIIVEESNPAYCSINGVLFSKDITTLVGVPAQYSGLYEVPNTVTSIIDCAFYGCTGLTSVAIPNSVTTIGKSAFEYCRALKEVTLPNSVLTIGEAAFSDCTGLSTMTIPNSVKSIGKSTFENCRVLKEVTLSNAMTVIPTNAFLRCFKLSSITIPNSVKSIGDGAFALCDALTEISCYASNPPEGDAYIFTQTTYESATLNIPVGSRERYVDSNLWSPFKNVVDQLPVTPLAELALSESCLFLEKDKEFQLNTYIIQEASSSSIAWTSSDESVAIVSQDGKVSTINNGVAVITATYADITAKCTVVVDDQYYSINYDPLILDITQSIQLEVSFDSRAANIVTWSSSDDNVAEVSVGGVVTGISQGVAVITATKDDLSCYFIISVGQAETPDVKMSATLGINDTMQLNVKADAKVEWSSSNPAVAEVSQTGLVTAKSSGTATVTAVWDDKTYTCKFIVEGTSGIIDIINENDTLEVYNLQGIRVEVFTRSGLRQLPAGYYIVNGKVELVK